MLAGRRPAPLKEI